MIKESIMTTPNMLQSQCQDIVGVMTHIQTWELAYQKTQFQSNKVKYCQSSLEELPIGITVLTPETLKEMDFGFKYWK
jgi:hypothetical protein